jgi:sortase A
MKWLRITGKFLISVGVGVLLFVAWVLWGTGIYTSQQQDQLREEFEQQPKIEAIEKKGAGKNGPTFRAPPDNYQPAMGDAVFPLTIPKIGVQDVVVQGVDVEELKKGPGHYPDCRDEFEKPLCTDAEEVWPGEEGRVILSGHRTTYGAPFSKLDELEPGDEIITNPPWGEVVYKVTKVEIVEPNATNIAIPQPGEGKAEIVLTTCHPEFSASQRLVVFGEMETA